MTKRYYLHAEGQGGFEIALHVNREQAWATTWSSSLNIYVRGQVDRIEANKILREGRGNPKVRIEKNS